MTATAHAFVINWSRHVTAFLTDLSASRRHASKRLLRLHGFSVFALFNHFQVLTPASTLDAIGCHWCRLSLALVPGDSERNGSFECFEFFWVVRWFSVWFYQKDQKGEDMRKRAPRAPGFWCLFETTAIWLFDGLAGVWPSRFERIALQNLWVLKQVYMALSFSIIFNISIQFHTYLLFGLGLRSSLHMAIKDQDHPHCCHCFCRWRYLGSARVESGDPLSRCVDAKSCCCRMVQVISSWVMGGWPIDSETFAALWIHLRNAMKRVPQRSLGGTEFWSPSGEESER